MNTVQIMIRNGYFASTHESSLKWFDEFEPKKIVVNGWICKIYQDGTIECNYKYENKKNGLCNMRYKISKQGFEKLSLKTHNSHIKVLKRGFVTNSHRPVRNGILTLTSKDGKRYVYYKDISHMFDD